MSATGLKAAASFSACDGAAGVLVLHGFTASVATVRSLAEAFADAGFSVEAPLLPGHGTSVEDLATTGFADWLACADTAYESLRARSDQVVVVGHSLGGTLALALATEHRDVAGLVLVNPYVEPPAAVGVELLARALDSGQETIPGIGGDIALPGAVEPSYAETPVRALISLLEGTSSVAGRLGEVSCPTLLITSRRDHVVPASHGELLVEGLAGPLERVVLEHSYHVATLDYDAAEVENRAVAFAQKCCA